MKFDRIYRRPLGLYVSAFKHRGRFEQVGAGWAGALGGCKVGGAGATRGCLRLQAPRPLRAGERGGGLRGCRLRSWGY